MIHDVHPTILPKPSPRKSFSKIVHDRFVAIEHFFEHGLLISEISSDDVCFPGF